MQTNHLPWHVKAAILNYCVLIRNGENYHHKEGGDERGLVLRSCYVIASNAVIRSFPTSPQSCVTGFMYREVPGRLAAMFFWHSVTESVTELGTPKNMAADLPVMTLCILSIHVYM